MTANFRGMWKPQKKPLSKMDREEVVKELRSFRNAWEKITTRDQDLSNERLKTETLTDLRKLLKFYYTEDAKTLAKQWLNIPLDDSDVTKPRRSRQRRRSSGSSSPVRRVRRSKEKSPKKGKKSRRRKSRAKKTPFPHMSDREYSSYKARKENTVNTNRPSPKFSATLFEKGHIKKGNDGNKWVVTVTSSGVYRWKKLLK